MGDIYTLRVCHGREEIPKRKREAKEGVQLSVLGVEKLSLTI